MDVTEEVAMNEASRMKSNKVTAKNTRMAIVVQKPVKETVTGIKKNILSLLSDKEPTQVSLNVTCVRWTRQLC